MAMWGLSVPFSLAIVLLVTTVSLMYKMNIVQLIPEMSKSNKKAVYWCPALR
jgi:hypothetical protein